MSVVRPLFVPHGPPPSESTVRHARVVDEPIRRRILCQVRFVSSVGHRDPVEV